MAEFLTVNLSSILKNQKHFDDYEATGQSKTAQKQEKDLSQISDWAKELKSRLAENQALDANNRKSDYEIETEFFEDYFSNGDAAWDENCTELLLALGDPLRKAIKILGFNRNINPILGFITDDFVIRNLLITKLLNVNTFKAVYNAVSKKLVADSEFFNANDYNIIFCQDLYRRSAAEILEYLTIQKSILSPSAATYTKADQDRNKKTFFYLPNIKELDPEKRAKEILSLQSSIALPAADEVSTKLNSLEVIHSLRGTNNSNNVANKNTDKGSSKSSTLARKVGDTPASILAAIQYISATSNMPEAVKALKHEAFKKVSMDALITVSASVNKIMKEAELPNTEIKTFIALLLGRLESMV
jgi:hypothetical protein